MYLEHFSGLKCVFNCAYSLITLFVKLSQITPLTTQKYITILDVSVFYIVSFSRTFNSLCVFVSHTSLKIMLIMLIMLHSCIIRLEM
jgi:hypothetical protein